MAKGDRLVEWLKKSTDVGGFAAMFPIDFSSLKAPRLVASTDGVGTKLILAKDWRQLSGVGQDLVAMCVNDLYCTGARPLFFLDYFAAGKVDEDQFQTVVGGIRDACDLTGATLIGGETAELPGIYRQGHFDLAGFAVGVVDQDQALGPANVSPGDKLFALQSSGFHSNGYSLLRRWIAERSQPAPAELRAQLLEPTRLYHQIPELVIRSEGALHALANITGGGISGNLCRVIPDGATAQVDAESLPTPEWMRRFITEHGKSEVLKFEDVFNLGAGMIAVVSGQSDAFVEAAGQADLAVTEIGAVVSSPPSSDAKVRFR